MPEAFREIQVYLEGLKEKKGRLKKAAEDTTAVDSEILEIQKILNEFEGQSITIEELQ